MAGVLECQVHLANQLFILVRMCRVKIVELNVERFQIDQLLL